MTRAEQVRQQLAAEIAAGVLAPGTHLDETEQSLRLGVSRTPLREALRQLAALGLVHGTPHKGMTVSEGISPHIADALAELEALCACRAACRMSGQDRHALRKAVGERGAWLEFIHAHAANPVLVRLAETLWQPLAGPLGAARFAADDLHPLGAALAGAVVDGDPVAIAAAARSYVAACAAAVHKGP